MAVDAGIECIGCGVCYTACDVVSWNPDYLGPAALNRAWTLVNDVRDAGQRRAPGRGVGRCRLPFLPHAHELHRTLPEGDRADLFDCGPEAQHDGAGAEAPMTAILFAAQRLTAILLAFAVVLHLATILYAVRGGLTAGEVLARTQGNRWFLAFYLVFVVAVAIHAPIGLRNILREWTSLARRVTRHRGGPVRIAAARAGLRAVFAVFTDDARVAQAKAASSRRCCTVSRHRAGDLPAAAFSGARDRAQRRRRARTRS